MSTQPDEFDALEMSQFGIIGTGGFEDCNDEWTYYNETDACTWGSSDPSVCGIAGPGTIDANAPGSCTISASFASPSWQWDGGECVRFGLVKAIADSQGTVCPNYGCQQPLNCIIQQYYSYPTGSPPYVPGCGTFTSSGHTTNFSFAELNVNQEYSWAILTSTFLTGLQNTRNSYGPMTVTSGYREPAENYSIGGAPGSQHVHGDAADIASTQSTWQNLHDKAKQNGACVEPVNYKGYNDWAHVHMDWRGPCPNGW